ncbi:MAG TPA: hypothetical protein VJ399_01950 [Patescibacteria group bacterium]|nr:hypothetical protein [Patescibacteria group bacterium]
MADTIANRDVSRVLGKLNEWWDRMAQAGLEFDNLQTPITDTAFRERLADFWLSGALVESSQQVRAREIMGDHFYGIGDLIRYFREGFEFDDFSPLTYPYQQALTKIPFSAHQLMKYRKTHILFPGYKEFNIPNLLCLDKLSGFLKKQDWDKNKPYMKETYLGNRWYLVRLKPFPYSIVRSFEKQILPDNEEVPRACVVTMEMAYYYLRHNHFFPYTNQFLTCKDLDSNDGHVYVGIEGPFYSSKFTLPEWDVKISDSEFGLASMVKLSVS